MYKPLRVVRIVEGTSVDGPGLRTSIYFAGCYHRCPGCHNQQTWPFDAGSDMSVDEIMDVVRYNQSGVTFSGGDPIYQAEAIVPLAKAIKAEGLDIWCYTGFTMDELLASDDSDVAELLKYVDVIVDGPFIEAQRDITLLFRGSANQRLIDVPATLAKGEAVLFEGIDTSVF